MTIWIGGKVMHLGYFGAGHPGEGWTRRKGLGEEFERQLPGQVMPAPAARGALPQHTVPARAPRGLMRPGARRQGLSELVELLGLVEGGEPVEEETSRST